MQAKREVIILCNDFCRLRAQFTTDDIEFNGLHGSSNEDEFERELQFFFPKEQTVAVIKPNAINEKGYYIV